MKLFYPILSGILSTGFFALIQVVLKFWLKVPAEALTLSEQIKNSVPYILMIAMLGIVGSSLWLFAIQSVSLGQIYWTTALAYIAIPLLDYIFFREIVTKDAIIGYTLISIGAILASRSK